MFLRRRGIVVASLTVATLALGLVVFLNTARARELQQRTTQRPTTGTRAAAPVAEAMYLVCVHDQWVVFSEWHCSDTTSAMQKIDPTTVQSITMQIKLKNGTTVTRPIRL